MIRKLVVVLLTGVMCLIGLTSALAVPYNEAPMLRTMVAAGELPPVEERLPEEPLVIEPFEEIGQYGGIAHTVTLNPRGYGDDTILMRVEGILSLSSDGSKIIPNIAKSWKLSEDAKILTLYLRKGMRWSDGYPFTADDMLFQFNDCLANKELYPVTPIKWSPGGELAKAEKVDDYTVRLHFVKGYPIAPAVLSHSGGWQGGVFQPKHYLEQFHPNYTPIEKLSKVAKEEGFDYWYQLFQKKAQTIWGSQLGDVPVISSYVVTEETSSYRKYERNPYYWKVDTAGNQLPYIDRVLATVVKDTEMATAKIVAGEVDFAIVNTTSIQNLPLYRESEERGNYRTLLWKGVYTADCGFEFNRTVEDPVLREIFRDVRFQHAASLAINREEINNMIYYGLGTPMQATVHPNCSWYEEKFAKAYVEYDPKRANALLDEMGLRWDGNHEYRLRPDGKRLSILLEFVRCETPKPAICELVKEQWKKVGFDLMLKEVSWNLEREHIKADKSQLGLWHVSPVLDAIWFAHEPFWCVIVEAETRWGSKWGKYVMSKGKAGEEPPEEVLKVQRLWEAQKTTLDEEERILLGKQILASQAENLWTIGTVGLAPVPIIVANNLKNVPEESLWGWDFIFGTYSCPEQFFFEQK